MTEPRLPRTYWSGLFAMSCCAFVLVASEFMPVSLLTPIAADLNVSEGMAGWGIGISGLFAVLTSLLLPKLLGKIDRRTALLSMTALMGLSGLLIALSEHYWLYMTGRALIGIVVGGFWSMSVAVAMRLVPADKIPRAMAIFNGGNALATILAAPLGSYLGELIGWRGVFLLLLPLSIITLLWQRFSLPPLPTQAKIKTTAQTNNVFKLLISQRSIGLGMLACGLFFMGQFALFTYIRPFLETITGVKQAETLSLILLVIGIMGLIGNLLIGFILKRSLYAVLGSVPVFMALIASGLIGFGHYLPAVVVLLAIWGLLGTAAPVGWWSWLAKTIPHNAESGGALMVAVIQLAIGMGSIIGGKLFDQVGYTSTFSFSAALLLSAAACCWLLAKEQCRELNKQPQTQPA